MKHGVLAFVVSVALLGCADEDPIVGEGPCVEDASLCATVHVPEDYGSMPVKIIVGLYESLPPKTPPIDVVTIVEQPGIAGHRPVDVEAHDMTTSGEYFVYVALYNQGGGNFVPVPGVDYVWESEGKLSVGNRPVNLGDIVVTKLPAE